MFNKRDMILSETLVLLVNYNNYSDTIDCIKSLERSVIDNFQICIVDNCSQDESLQYFKIEFCLKEMEHDKYLYWIGCKGNIKVHLFQNKGNLGFASANNIGINFACQQLFKFVWILNNDTVVLPETLSNLIGTAEVAVNNKKNIAIGARVLSYYTNDFDSDGFGYLNLFTSQTSHLSKYIVQKKYLVASSLFLNASNQLPLMDDRFFLYYEDIDYSIQLTKANYELIFDSSVLVRHKISASTKLNENIENIKIESMVSFYKKNYRYLLPILLATRLFYYVLKGRYNYLGVFLKQF
ncbi:glycosyltransferase family 2 protein [Flavobacterium sp. GT2N3]|uniref:glycosyltransferase family 2 protein n=1 Tax=unclassified Flavobacterium TaxID=196869 RepID=UPI003AAB9498